MSARYAMRYFATVSKSSSDAHIEDKVLASNPITEVRLGSVAGGFVNMLFLPVLGSSPSGPTPMGARWSQAVCSGHRRMLGWSVPGIPPPLCLGPLESPVEIYIAGGTILHVPLSSLGKLWWDKLQV